MVFLMYGDGVGRDARKSGRVAAFGPTLHGGYI